MLSAAIVGYCLHFMNRLTHLPVDSGTQKADRGAPLAEEGVMEFEPKFIPIFRVMVDQDLKLVALKESLGLVQGDEEHIGLTCDPELGPCGRPPSRKSYGHGIITYSGQIARSL